MAMYGAYTFHELRSTGRLVLPPLPNPLSLIEGIAGLVGLDLELPNIPTFVGLGDSGFTVPPAMAVSLPIAAALGYAVHALVFRPLRHAPPLAKTVASVGVILVLQADISLRFGSDPRSAAPHLPDDPVRILDGIVKAGRLWPGAIPIVLAAAPWALFLFPSSEARRVGK